MKLSPFSITPLLLQATFWVQKCAPQFAATFARVWPRKICQNQGAVFCTSKCGSLYYRTQQKIGLLGDLPRCLKLSPFSITFILTQATFWVHKCAPQFAAHFARVWPRKICQNQGAMFCTPKIWLSLSLHKRKQSVLGANNNNNEHNNDGIMI